MNLKIHRLTIDRLAKSFRPNYGQDDLKMALSIMTNVCKNIEMNTNRPYFNRLLLCCTGSSFSHVNSIVANYKKAAPEKRFTYACDVRRHVMNNLRELAYLGYLRRRQIRGLKPLAKYQRNIYYKLNIKGKRLLKPLREKHSLRLLPSNV